MNTTNEPLHQWKPVEDFKELRKGDIVRTSAGRGIQWVVAYAGHLPIVSAVLSMEIFQQWELLVTEPEPTKEPELLPCPRCGYPPKKVSTVTILCQTYSCNTRVTAQAEWVDAFWNALPRKES